MATNTRAPVELSKLAIPYLLESKGNIVNVSSVGGIIPIEIALVYSMSKAALDHFTKNAAMEFAGTHQVNRQAMAIFKSINSLFFQLEESGSTR